MINASNPHTICTIKIGEISPNTHQVSPIPSALIHGDLWGSFIVLDRGDLELLEHISTSLSQIMVTQA